MLASHRIALGFFLWTGFAAGAMAQRTGLGSGAAPTFAALGSGGGLPNASCNDRELLPAIPATLALELPVPAPGEQRQAVWYSVIGTGNQLTATTCGNIGSLSGIQVYCGECDIPRPVGFGEPCGPSADGQTVQWRSQPGTEYRIRVEGSGSFILAVFDDGIAMEADVDCGALGGCCLASQGFDATCEDCAFLGGFFLGSESSGVATVLDNGTFEDGPGSGAWEEASTWRGSPIDATFDTRESISADSFSPLELDGSHLAIFSLGRPAPFLPTPPSVEIGRLSQEMHIPLGTASLRFYLRIHVFLPDGISGNPLLLEDDFLSVSVDETVLRTFTQEDHAHYLDFVRVDLDVRDLADGAIHTIAFDSRSELFSPTLPNYMSFGVDRVQLVSQVEGCSGRIDFELLQNGKAILPTDIAGVTVTGLGDYNHGAAVFDSSSGGPNTASSDPDLLIDAGGILVLQENGLQSTPGIFDHPDDAAFGGSFFVQFDEPCEAHSVDLVDIDAPAPLQAVAVVLTDLMAKRRIYLAPSGFTRDIHLDGPPGFATLDLLTTSPQPGYTATAILLDEEPSYDPSLVVAIQIFMSGSGAIDNLVYRAPSRASMR